MFCVRRAAFLGVLLLTLDSAPRAQDTTIPRSVLTPQEMETFLLKGRISGRKTSPAGVTAAYRVTITDDRTTHDAQVQNVDIFRTSFEVDPKHTEFNFRDTYRYNVAGYRLARLLGLDNVPMSVERIVEGKRASITWWIDDVAMDEGGRSKLTGTASLGPDPVRTTGYLNILKVFDELIQNRDRNRGNLLWTKDWTMWMIDHTRAFRVNDKLLNPELLTRCDRDLLESMRKLTRDSVAKVMGDMLLKPELDALMKRRDAIVKLIDERVAQRGEAAVLYTMTR